MAYKIIFAKKPFQRLLDELDEALNRGDPVAVELVDRVLVAYGRLPKARRKRYLSQLACVLMFYHEMEKVFTEIEALGPDASLLPGQ